MPFYVDPMLYIILWDSAKPSKQVQVVYRYNMGLGLYNQKIAVDVHVPQLLSQPICLEVHKVILIKSPHCEEEVPLVWSKSFLYRIVIQYLVPFVILEIIILKAREVRDVDIGLIHHIRVP